MAIDGVTFEFLDFPGLLHFLRIKPDTDDHVILRNTIAPSADKYVKNKVFGSAESFPLPVDLMETAASAAFKKGVSIYKTLKNNLEGGRQWEEMAKIDIEDLKGRMRDDHTPRTQIVISSQRYDTEDDELFSQQLR